jgi:prephenate dehydrogenase
VKKPQIGIIGGTGGIGRWFVDFFQKEGYPVQVTGRNTGPDYATLVRQCPVVVVSVPIKVTSRVIEQVGPFMPEASLLMDLTSLKEKPIKAMLKFSCSEVIGLHPLFGPRTKSIAGHGMVICPARGEKWIPWVKNLFHKTKAVVIETTPRRHDKWMAVVQGLNHLNSITMGLVLDRSNLNLKELEIYATPMFKTKLDILKQLFGRESRLYSEIITENPHIHHILREYQGTLSNLKELIVRKNSRKLQKLIDSTPLFHPQSDHPPR